MSLLQCIYIILILLLIACKPEPSGLTYQFYVNQSEEDVKVILYPDTFPYIIHNNEFYLNLGESFNISNSQMGTHPSNLWANFGSKDSILVIYNDSLIVTHYNYTMESDSVNTAIIGFYEARNIFNKDSFVLDIKNDEHYIYTYTFTNEDLEYAISINE